MAIDPQFAAVDGAGNTQHIDPTTLCDLDGILQAQEHNSGAYDTIFASIFSDIQLSEGHQSSDVAHKILDNFHSFLSKAVGVDGPFDSSATSSLEDMCSQLRNQQQQYLLLPDFGCAIVLDIDCQCEEFKVHVVFPLFSDGIISNQHNIPTAIRAISGDMHQFSISFSIAYDGVESFPLEEGGKGILEKFEALFNECKTRHVKSVNGEKDRKNHHTPSWIFAVVESLCAYLERTTLTADTTLAFPGGRSGEEDVVHYQLSKGGTMDVGQHTGIGQPNTEWPVVCALLYHLCDGIQNKHANPSICRITLRAALVAYKLFVIENVTSSPQDTKTFHEVQDALAETLEHYRGLVLEEDQVCVKTGGAAAPSVLHKERFSHKFQQIAKRNVNCVEVNGESPIQTQKAAVSVNSVLSLPASHVWAAASDPSLSNDLKAPKSGPGLPMAVPVFVLPTDPDAINRLRNSAPRDNSILSTNFWLHNVEQMFWHFSFSLLHDDICKMDNQQAASTLEALHSLIKMYEDRVKQKEFGCVILKSQIQTHTTLIRIIGACLAFELCALDPVAKIMASYRPPFDSKELRALMSTVDTTARTACRRIIEYLDKIEDARKPAFVLENSVQSFHDIANKAQCPIVDQKEKDLELSLAKKVQDFRERVETFTKELNECDGKWKAADAAKTQHKTNCTSRFYHRCTTCVFYENGLSNAESNLRSKKEEKIQQVTSPFHQGDLKLSAFLKAMPSCFQHTVNVVFHAQAQRQVNRPEGECGCKYANVHLFVDAAEPKSIKLIEIHQHIWLENIVLNKHTVWPKTSSLAYSDTSFMGKAPLKPAAFCETLPAKDLQWMIDAPTIEVNDGDTRENIPFAELSCGAQKKLLNSLTEDAFCRLGSVRACTATQFTRACDVLCNASDFPLEDTVDNNSMIPSIPRLVAAQTIAHLISKDEGFGCDLSVENLLKNIVNSRGMKPTDVDALPTVAQVSTMLSNEATDVPTAETYSRINRLLDLCHNSFCELGKDADNELQRVQNSANQSIVCASALCCFKDLTPPAVTAKPPPNVVELFQRYFFFVIQYHHTVTISSTREVEEQITRREDLAALRIRTISDVVEHVRELLLISEKVQQRLFDAIRCLDQQQDVLLSCRPLDGNRYGFALGTENASSKETTVFEVDIFTGGLLRNGELLSGLPDAIRQNKFYKKLFGETRNFEVSRDHQWFTTCHNFQASLFPMIPDDIKVFFKFHATTAAICLKFDTPSGTEEWMLDTSFAYATIGVPDMYLEETLPWRCGDLVAFRKFPSSDIGACELVLKTERTKAECRTTAAIVPPEKRADLVLKAFCPKKEGYDLLVLFPPSHENGNDEHPRLQDEKTAAVYHQLSVLESADHIHLRFRQLTQEVVAWLPRFSITFTVDIKTSRLHSEFRKGYIISQPPVGLWDPTNFTVRGLWLQNIPPSDTRESLSATKHMQYQLLLPNVAIETRGKMSISRHYGTKYEYFMYELHDHFDRLFGKELIANLHLATLLAATSSAPWARTKLTGHAMSLSLVRACYQNMPLSNAKEGSRERDEGDILRELVQHGCPSVVLAAACLWKLSSSCCDVFGVDGQSTVDKGRYRIAAELYKERCQRGLMPDNLRLNPRECELVSVFSVQSKARSPFHKLTSSLVSKVLLIEKPNTEDHLPPLEVQTRTPGQFPFTTEEEHEAVAAAGDGGKLLQQMLSDLRDGWQELQVDVAPPEELVEALQKRSKELQLKAKHYKQDVEKALQQFERHFAALTLVEDDQQRFYHREIHNMEVAVGNTTFITRHDYTPIMCQGKAFLQQRLPLLCEEDLDTIMQLIHNWFDASACMDLCRRLQAKKEDLSMKVLRWELESPRTEIGARPHWLAFEVEQRIRIRQPQFDTFTMLMSSLSSEEEKVRNDEEEGILSQLNMGEGKTHVIMPMIILDCVYSANGSKLCRIVELGALVPEVLKAYRSALSYSGFSISVCEFPFHRGTKLSTKLLNSFNKTLKFLSPKAIVLLAREHEASFIQKCRELTLHSDAALNRLGNKAQAWFIASRSSDSSVTLFDESDELLAPQFRLVYSIGGSTPLPDSEERYALIPAVLEALTDEGMLRRMHEMGVVILENMTLDAAVLLSKSGGFPLFRFKPVEEWPASFSPTDLYEALFAALVDTSDFLEFLKEKRQSSSCDSLYAEAIDFVVDVEYNPMQPRDSTGFFTEPARRNPLLLLRGLFANGLLLHCLQLRLGVRYGLSEKHVKRIAVPYDAADTPSARSEFSHPDVALVLTFVAYFAKGLSSEQFKKELLTLFVDQLNESSQDNTYTKWRDSVKVSDEASGNAPSSHNSSSDVATAVRLFNQETFPKKASEISLKFEKQVDNLFTVFKFNRRAVTTFLVHLRLRQDMRQFNDTIVSSASDLTDKCCPRGFSGTKDNMWVLPQNVSEPPQTNASIRSTDALMTHLLMENCTDVLPLERDDVERQCFALWQQFLLDAAEQKAHAAIDAGALLVGQSLEEVCKWFAKQPQFLCLGKKGITFFHDGTKRWVVYDVEAHCIVASRTHIHELDTFIIFDEAHCRGSDCMIAPDALAILSVGPKMVRARLMQAVGRLRQFGRNQKVRILYPTSLGAQFGEDMRKSTVKEKVKALILWTLSNSSKEVVSQKYSFAQLCLQHLENRIAPKAVSVHSSLEKMYCEPVGMQPLKALVVTKVQAASGIFGSDEEGKQREELFVENVCEFADGVHCKTTTLDDECEREAEEERVQEQECERQHSPFNPHKFNLEPIKTLWQNTNQQQRSDFNVSDLPLLSSTFTTPPLAFSDEIRCTTNFINLAEQRSSSSSSTTGSPQYLRGACEMVRLPLATNNDNNSYVWVLLSPSEFQYIFSQQKGAPTANSANLSILHLCGQEETAMHIPTTRILAELDCFNGISNFDKAERVHVKAFLARSKQQAQSQEYHCCYHQLASDILERRDLLERRFVGSKLQSLAKSLSQQQ